MEGGGWAWILLDIIGVLVLAGIIAYGILVTHRRRSRAIERKRDAATKQIYEAQDRAPGP